MTEHDAGERRVGTIQGDRLCVGCGFNLTGQPIVREGRYDLLIARCPECGTVAAMQEYPVLGRWANRWAALLAATWLLAMVGLILGPGSAIFGGVMSIGDGAATAMSEEIGNRYLDYVVERFHAGVVATNQTEAQWVTWLRQTEQNLRGPATTAGGGGGLPDTISQETIDQARASLGYWASVDQAWWDRQDRVEIRRAVGGLRGALAHVEVGAWFWLVALTFAYGVVLSVALIGRARRFVLLVALAPVAFALVLAVVFRSPTVVWAGMGGVQASQLAREMVWAPLCAGVLGIAYVSMGVGIAFGRPIARLTLVALLPPRLRGALAFVWTAEGKDPPRPGGRRGRAGGARATLAESPREQQPCPPSTPSTPAPTRSSPT